MNNYLRQFVDDMNPSNIFVQPPGTGNDQAAGEDEGDVLDYEAKELIMIRGYYHAHAFLSPSSRDLVLVIVQRFFKFFLAMVGEKQICMPYYILNLKYTTHFLKYQ